MPMQIVPGWTPEGRRSQSDAPRSIITDVALTTAVALTPAAEPQLLDRVARDRGGHQKRPRLDLDERHHTVALDRPDHAREAVAGRPLGAGLVAGRARAQALHLRRGHEPAVAGVPGGLDLALAVPPPQRVDAYASAAAASPSERSSGI